MNEILKLCLSHHDTFSESILSLLNGGMSREDVMDAVDAVVRHKADVELLEEFKSKGWAWFSHDKPDAKERISALIKSDIMCDQAIHRVETAMARHDRITLHTRKETFVYLMLNNRNGYFKIGISKNPNCREKTLQSEEPDLEMICTWPGTLDDERFLHEAFKEKRVRGEWFRLEDEDTDFIDDYMKSTRSRNGMALV